MIGSIRKDQPLSVAGVFQRTRNDKASRSQGANAGFSWGSKSAQRQSAVGRGPKAGPARYLSEERRSAPRYGFALKPGSGIAQGRLRTAFTGPAGGASAKKKEFLQTQSRLEEVVMNLDEAVRSFQDKEMQYKGGQDESGRSALSQFDGQPSGVPAGGSHPYPNNRYRDLTAKSVARATFFNQKPKQGLGQSVDQVNDDAVSRNRKDTAPDQYWANKGGRDPIKQSYMGYREGSDDEPTRHPPNKPDQNINIQDFLQRNNHSMLNPKAMHDVQYYDLGQDVRSLGKSAATQMREEHAQTIGSGAARQFASRQQRPAGAHNMNYESSFDWNDAGKHHMLSSMQHSRSFQRTAGESRSFMLTESLLNHQPDRLKEVRVKKVLQRYQRMKQRSASVLDDNIVVQRPRSGTAHAKPIVRFDQRYFPLHTASGTNFLPRTASLRAVARGGNYDGISSGDLFSPTRRGCTQIKNHIVKKHHDTKIVKAYEVAELVERSATLLNLNRSRDLEEDEPKDRQVSIKIDEPQIVGYTGSVFRSPIRSPPVVTGQPLDKDDEGQQQERSMLNNVSFTQASCEEVSSAIEGSCQMSEAVRGAGQDRAQSATPFKSSVNVGQSNSRVTSQTDPQASLPITNEQSKNAGSQTTKKGSGGAPGRREAKKALRSVRELDLGRHSQALNMSLLSLSSESSHPSELEIFGIKHYGPGEECPYLSRKVQDRASEILEQSRRQFFEENCTKRGNFLKRQSSLLNSVTETMEKMLVKDQRNGNGAVVKVEGKSLNSLPSLAPEQVDSLFWARMEDLKFGQVPMMNSRKGRPGGLKALDRSRGTMQDVYQTTSGPSRTTTNFNIDARSSSVQAKTFVAVQAKPCAFATVQGGLNYNQDQKNRFFESCRQQCTNRKIRLENQQLGPRTAQELRHIFETGHHVSQLLLNKNCLGDDGVRILAQCFVGNRKNFLDFQKRLALSPGLADRSEKRGKSLFLIKRSKDQSKASDAARRDQLNADLHISQGEKSEEVASNLAQKEQDKGSKSKEAGGVKLAKEVSDADASYPSKYSEIVALDLSQNCLTHVGAACLFQALRYNQTLVHLSLGNTDARHKNHVGAKGARYLKDLLKLNQTLTILDLKGNTLCDQGIFQLCQGLRHNVGLMDLNISQNGFSVFGVEFLKDALAANPKSNIRSLDISFNNIEALGVAHLSSMLRLDSLKLKSLNVDGCGIQGQPSLTFFRGVKSCSTLRQLRASKNDFSHPSLGRTMALALSYSLQQIHLEYCMLGTQGALNVIKAMESNKLITVVSLKGNNIETIAAQQLGKLLPTRSLHLESLDLSENLLYDEGGRAVAEGLEKNESLKKLFIHCNSLEKPAGLAFRQAAERNRVILVLGLADNHIDLALLDEVKGRLERNKAALSGQQILNMRNEERQIERDKNHYKTETKSSLIRERRGLNRKKRQVREEERKLRSDVADLVAHNRKQEAKLKELRDRERALGYQQKIEEMNSREQVSKNRRKAEKEKKEEANAEVRREQKSLQAQIEEVKRKLAERETAGEEYGTAAEERRIAFADLQAVQQHYADSSNLYKNDRKVFQGGSSAPDANAMNGSAPGTKTSSKGKGTTRVNTGVITSPGERSGKGSKGKKDGKKK